MVTLYSVLLHGLVFVVLYKMAMTESCKHDMAAKWHEKYIEHMQVRRKLNIYIYVVEVQEVNTLNSLHTSFLLNVTYFTQAPQSDILIINQHTCNY